MAVKGKASKKKAEKAAPDVEEEEVDAEAPKKKSKKAPEAKAPSKPVKVEEPEEEEDEDDEGSDSEGSESEDEEGAESEEAEVVKGAIVVSKGAPKAKGATKKRKTKAHRLEEAQARADGEGGGVEDEHIPKGVIYVGHLPLGFAEPQMRKYFNQFGTVLRLRLSRSRKNAKSKGYAFVEFEEEDVAKIVAQTMDGYLIFGKKLVCHLVEKAKLHPKLFKGWNKKMINWSKTRRKTARAEYNDRPTMEVGGEQVSRTTTRQYTERKKKSNKLAKMLEALEVDYDLSVFQVPDRQRSPKLKAADSLKIKAASSPKVLAASSPKLQLASSPKVAPKVSVEEIMEEAAAAAAAASAPSQEAASAAAGAGKGKKRKKAAAAA